MSEEDRDVSARERLEAEEIANNWLAYGGISKDIATYALNEVNASIKLLARAYLSTRLPTPSSGKLEELRVLAEKTTPGPWRAGITGTFTVYAPDGLNELSGPLCGKMFGPRRAENRDFIAACDPTTIKGLLSHITELDEALRCLLARVDSHFGSEADHSMDWREQEMARAVLARANPTALPPREEGAES